MNAVGDGSVDDRIDDRRARKTSHKTAADVRPPRHIRRPDRGRSATAVNAITSSRAIHYTDRPSRIYRASYACAPETRGIRVTGPAAGMAGAGGAVALDPTPRRPLTSRGCNFAQRRRYDTLRPAPDDVNHRTVSTASEQVSPTAVWQREIGRRRLRTVQKTRSRLHRNGIAKYTRTTPSAVVAAAVHCPAGRERRHAGSYTRRRFLRVSRTAQTQNRRRPALFRPSLCDMIHIIICNLRLISDAFQDIRRRMEGYFILSRIKFKSPTFFFLLGMYLKDKCMFLLSYYFIFL